MLYNNDMEDLDLALTLARERLPFSQEYPEKTISITLRVEEFYNDPLHIGGIGASGLQDEVDFTFEKMFVNDILVGWAFVRFSR